MSRVLLALVGCLLLVMPWTEYFCSFDHFLRGGGDMEFGLLAVLTVLCLVLVLFQVGRTLVASLLALLQWFATLYRAVSPFRVDMTLAVILQRVLPRPGFGACGTFGLPLQI